MTSPLLTPYWFDLRHHPEQQRLLRSSKKYKAVVAGRGSGKTEIARRYIVAKAIEKKPWSDPKYFFVGPTADQANRIGWKPILNLIPERWIKTANKNEKIITLINNAEIHVCSGQKPERLEGVQWDGGVIDESSDQIPTIFSLNLGPALTHRDAWCWRIGVPKRRGIGAAEFKAFYEKGLAGDPDIDSFHWESGDILTEEQLAERKRNLSPQDFEEQYMANWTQSTGLAYPDFTDGNVTEAAVYNPALPIIVGSDFNVDPMAWVLCHMIEGKLYQFDEIWLKGTNTRKTLDYLYREYGQHKAAWVFAGDASSTARKTSAAISDYLQIVNDGRFEPKHMLYPKKNPMIMDRLAATNAAIMSASGEIRYYVHPNCTYTINDLNHRHFKAAEQGKISPGNVLNDIGELGHITDALGYVIWQLIPLEFDGQKKIPKVGF